ncbi:PorP/SprF family type IX secretion system membrane protein [Brumimicrobium aurantiacum]|uniref:Type IX secretion system membrane protein PorP/SprF n=1 Tax=Brumimicrobium aurantiacum TaxID=1737063 RepID=A0A3E1EZA7_9FLAO|nr:PorP/SprF family type IX secretion system membrane protein [Brumimicrobium aurantiacum]RFC54885.1 type IX secretion system membrane protein PorP/SprF [Brumimicrobium aurantiacum]
MKFTLITVALTTVLFATAQQGTNFSMWFKNNMQHNAAAVGTNDNDLRVFTNFRNQYFSVTDSPFRTISASVEGKVFESKRKKNHFGLGATFINDVSGDGRYAVNNFKVPISYHIYFNDENSISLGVSPGVYQRSVGNGVLNWENQWNGYEFDQSINPEGIPNISVANFDLGAGIFYKHQTSKSNKVYFGFSANHVLEPRIGYNIQDNLYIRYVGQFGMSHRFYNSYFGISPQALAVFQGPNQNIIFGTNFDYYLQDASKRTGFYTPTVFSFGLYHRLRDAIVVNAQFSFKGLTIAASYDSNINSMLPSSQSIGGFEVALIYDITVNRAGKYIY